MALLVVAAPLPAFAATRTADPRTYAAAIRELRPGDTLELAPGLYLDGLRLHDLQGRAGAPIVVRGPRTGRPARFLARPGANTASLRNAAYLVLESLTFDGRGVPVDAIKAERSAFAHDVTISDVTIVNHAAHQQNVGISTKCPAWNWVIRGTRIVGAGTGMYLGDADGSAPFVAGLIEGNVVADTIGYNVQIKHQRGRPEIAGLPAGPSVTVIRHNVLRKGARSALGDMARPNLLLGHFPLSGAGASDLYRVYGNVFVDSPGEALLQAEGNIAVYNNVLVNRVGDGINIRPHNHRPRQVAVFNNTIVTRFRGLSVSGVEMPYVPFVEGNVVLADEPTLGAIADRNPGAPFAAAEAWLVLADLARGRLNPALAPDRRGRVAAAMPPAGFPDADLDFFHAPRATRVPGAVAGDGDEIALGTLDPRPTARPAGAQR